MACRSLDDHSMLISETSGIKCEKSVDDLDNRSDSQAQFVPRLGWHDHCFLLKEMNAKVFNCHVTDLEWLTSSVITIRFEPSKKFSFEPGQFLSLLVPGSGKVKATVKRCYSFANSPDDAVKNGYELCAKVVPNGVGSEFLAGLHVGDHFRVMAPYGDFQYRVAQPGRDVVFIATGTGIAPFRSMAGSELFKSTFRGKARLLFGARHDEELLYRGEFEKHHVSVHYAVTQPGLDYRGFKGRVTDLLKNNSLDIRWHQTDFYICGNGDMAAEVVEILTGLYGVSKRSIHRENFSAIQNQKKRLETKIRTAEIDTNVLGKDEQLPPPLKKLVA